MITELRNKDEYADYYTQYSEIFVSLAHSIFPYRQSSGYWDTVIMDPGFGYEESSGSALVAYCFAKGARLGLLPPEYRAYAKETFSAIVARMHNRKDGYSMAEISRLQIRLTIFFTNWFRQAAIS
jgi:unsaturated rhamnogalacturonyl hydrolase